jgi:Uma2 family endonuclease
MTSSAHPVSYPYGEYLEHEEACNTKNEYLDGEIYAMAGGSPQHNRLALAVGALLVPQLAAGLCRAYSSDQRVRVLATGLATYPDVTVICGAIEIDPDDHRKHTAINPTLLVEVLSPSTEAYDRGERFEHYKRIPTLQQYVLVSQGEPRLEVWTRDQDQWVVQATQPGETVELPSIGARIDVATLYDAATPPV